VAGTGIRGDMPSVISKYLAAKDNGESFSLEGVRDEKNENCGTQVTGLSTQRGKFNCGGKHRNSTLTGWAPRHS